MSPLHDCHSSLGFIGLAVVAVACLLAPHVAGPCWVPHWRTQIATLTLCSRIAEGCSRSTQARYGVKSPPPRHHRYSHPRDASGQLKHRTMPAQLVTSQQPDIRNIAVAYASVSSLSDVTTRFFTGSAVGRYRFLWCFYLDKFKLRGSDHLQRQVSCSFPLDLRGDSRLLFFFSLFSKFGHFDTCVQEYVVLSQSVLLPEQRELVSVWLRRQAGKQLRSRSLVLAGI